LSAHEKLSAEFTLPLCCTFGKKESPTYILYLTHQTRGQKKIWNTDLITTCYFYSSHFSVRSKYFEKDCFHAYNSHLYCTMDLCINTGGRKKNSRNAFGKHVYSKLEYSFLDWVGQGH